MNRWTLAAPARLEQEIKRSRFLCQAAPIDSAEAALGFLRAVSDPAATHNCWAFRLGELYRSSDDGEPAGTAGRPILAAIDGQGLDGVIAVVTRWYGGIKLGAGGLVRAYGGCAAECLRMAPRVAVVERQDLRLRCGFTDLGDVHGLLGLHGVEKLDEQFDADGVVLGLRIASDRVEDFAHALREASRGRLQLTRGKADES
ncbi:IMPACT family protein [Aquimonas voraii]|uniref:Uncharacterized protein, YigZ family n=1 Tax=Aquimonas voraii TaxID=265719 RepID=A0A1G6UUU4_9GAMM|nr:YigZ family protein [Aquimonas voraii]SDD45092.1 uncharacterized protein, YigZ family [Aquimonas voraii]